VELSKCNLTDPTRSGRNIFGGVLPLVNNIMFQNITYQGASSLLGGVGFLLTLVPWILVFYGHQIRARSKFASNVSMQSFEHPRSL
jgi:hypothetical protein